MIHHRAKCKIRNLAKNYRMSQARWEQLRKQESQAVNMMSGTVDFVTVTPDGKIVSWDLEAFSNCRRLFSHPYGSQKKMLKLNSQGLNTKSFLRFENSTKYPNSIAVFCHEDGRPGGEYIILDWEQVVALRNNLTNWLNWLTENGRKIVPSKIEGEGL